MIEVLKQALTDAKRNERHNNVAETRYWLNQYKLIAEQAIAELESQEPVAWQVHPFDYGIGHKGVYARTDRPEQVELWKRKGWNVQPLHTYPPAAQRTWVGLTDEEIQECYSEAYKIVQGRQLEIAFYKTIEAKLKEKNGFTEENT
jgi:hypothetical protein